MKTLRTATLLAAASCALAVGCADLVPEPASPEVTPARQEPLFTNSGFEDSLDGGLVGWTVTTGLIPSQVPIYPVTQESDLGITAGGTNLTSVDSAATPYSLIPFGLTAGDKARYPRFGNRAAMVNEGGYNNNTNKVTQASVVTTADIDPADGLVHVRFTVLPVLQNPGHALRQQPFYYVTILNQTKGTVLASRFNFSNEAGVPWQTNVSPVTYGLVVYTDWLLFDLPLARSAASIGDTLVATVIAGGCGPSGHWGEAIVDSFGSSIPGLVVYGAGPDGVEAGSDYQYTYRILNGSAATATGVRLTSYLPAGTTFRSLDTPGVTCTTPPLGVRGTVACDVGAIGVGGQAIVKVTVRADTTAASPIRHGWYYSQSNQEQPLTGPVVVTNVTTGGTTQYVDLVTSVDDARAGVAWGQTVTYSVTVRNNGPATANGAVITTNSPSQLTVQSWSCTPLAGATCGAASGSGPLATTANLPAGGAVAYTLEAQVVAGSGPGLLSFTASAAPPAGTVERFGLDNGAGDDDAITDGLALVTVNRAGAGAGTIVSTPAGLTCGEGCTSTTGSFAGGTPVTFQAVPAAGSVFAGWSGGTCSGTGACTFTVGAGQTVTGTFNPLPVAITSPLTASAAVGRPFSYTLTASGTAPVTLGATGLPAWALFDPATGIISGTPSTSGVTSVTVTATDVSGTDTRTLTLTAGNAPTITSSLTATVATAGGSWAAIRVQASGDTPVQLNASNLPGTVSFNGTTGYFGGSAGGGVSGVFNIPLVATNAFGSDYKVLAVSVGGSPVITSALTASATVGTPFSYQLTATGTAPLTLGATGLPSWASFDPGTGLITGTPTAAGTHSIGLSAANAVGTSAQTLFLTVDGPAVITSALTASGTAGAPFSYSLTAEGTQPITRGMTGLPAWASFNPSTGLLSGTPPSPGSFTVTMTATNALGTDTETLSISIAQPPPTPTPPSITSALTSTGFVGEAYTYAVTASGQVPMTFSATGLPAWASLDPATGVVSGTPSGTGVHTISLTATNALGTDTETLTLSVVARPHVTSALTASAAVGQPFSYTLTATGTAPLTLAMSGVPAWATFVSATGVLSGTPSTEGLISLTVEASNAYGTDSQTLALTVRTAPAITSALTASAVVGQPFSYTTTATGTAPITFAATGLPSWASLDPATGVLSGTPDTEGSSSITLSAGNAAGTDTETLALTVRTAPAITSALAASGAVGQPFSYTVTASGTRPVTFGASGLPSWASFDVDSGVLSGTPDAEGATSVTLSVTNAAGSDSETLVLTVRTVPAITSALTASAVVGQAFSSTLTATGTAPVTFGASGLPSWASLDPATGVLSGTPDAEGTTSVTLTATNAAGSDSETLVLTVRTRPVITNALSGQGAVGLPFSLTFTATGTPAITFSADGVPAGLSLSDATLSGTPTAAGSFSVTETATNLAGSATATVVLEVREAIPAPTIAQPTEGGSVNTTTPTLSGSAPVAEAGNTVQLSEGGTVLCSAVIEASGSWACSSSELAPGAHTVTAVLIDTRGLTGTSTDTQSFTVDVTIPAAPAWAGPAAQANLKDATPELSGEGETGALVTVTRAGEAVCTATVDPEGRWACTPSSPLPDGPLTLTATQTDVAGNTSPGVDLTVTIDTVAPAAPTLSAPMEGAILQTATPTLSGEAEPGATVTVDIDGQPACTTTASASGTYACAPSTPLDNGPHTATARATDAAGNTGATASRGFTVDGAAPNSPTVTGVPADGGRTADATPSLEGTAEPGTTIEVKVDGVVVCTTTAGADGRWACPPTATLPDGVHTSSVTATDAAGNTSAPRTGSFDVQTATGSLTPPSSGKTTENGTLEGTATPGATINVYVDGEQVGSTTAGADGSWSYTLPLLPAGEHRVSVGIENADGVEVYRSPEELLGVSRPTTDLGGGIGCSQAGSSPAGLLAVLLLAGLLRVRPRRGVALAAVVALATAGSARAQTSVRGFELEQLVLNPGARSGLVVGGGDVLPPAGYRLALSLGYEHAPLKYIEDGVWRSTPVEHRWTALLSGAAGLTPWLEVGAIVPVVLYQNGSTALSRAGELVLAVPTRGASMGTPWLQARVGFLREAAQAPLDLALSLLVSLPVGSAQALTSDHTVTGQLVLGAGRTFGPVRLALEVGGHLRPSTTLLAPQGTGTGTAEAVGSRLSFGLGVATTGSGLRGELSAKGLASLTQQPFSVELLAGVRYPIKSLELYALAGPGFGNAPGTPVVRALVGVAFGGPVARPCGDEAADITRCADSDADGDGTNNGVDRCPSVAGPASEGGCPPVDADGDGVPDASDACPKEAGSADARGCPPAPPPAPKDTDGDGVADDADACPAVAGEAARGGCPAPAPAPKQVELKVGRIELKGKVYFDTSRATLQPRSFPLLDEVAQVMRARPEVTRVAIDGHTDSMGDEGSNQRLSLARAEAVRDFLVKAGVEPQRLEARGFGETKPMAPNDTPEGREQNRRVEFIVLE